MDIEQIETFITMTINGIVDIPDAPTDTITLLVLCQLLLHIYKKLDAIEEELKTAHETAPGAW